LIGLLQREAVVLRMALAFTSKAMFVTLLDLTLGVFG
jgi:hypothetical protein